MPYSDRTALLPLFALLLPACVPSIIVGDQPQDTATAPGTSETPPDTATATTVTPTTSAPATTSETDPASTADTAVSATDDATSTATASTTSDTTGTPGTTSTTEAVSTTDVSTTVADPGETTTTGSRPDLPSSDALVGCTLDAPAGTLVEGPTFFGQFSSQRAYFGWTGVDDPFSPHLVLLSPGADPETELPLPQGTSGVVLEHWVSTDTSLEEGWLGTWETTALVHENQMTHVPQETDAVTITALAGNWDTHDPADPPRLVGTIQGPISGSFDAVFCDKLVAIIIPE
ncbi:hypothetical protein [Nannocystis pusilla]|uniref:hypothetical protein n=1 Tax=Nannocystis pusilla TaxID=889268 RepID=UPI003DA391EC